MPVSLACSNLHHLFSSLSHHLDFKDSTPKMPVSPSTHASTHSSTSRVETDHLEACSPLRPSSLAQKLALQLKAQFNNVTNLLPSDPDHTLMLKLKCTSCHEEHSKLVGVTPSDEHEMTKGARGSANLVMSCSVSSRPLFSLQSLFVVLLKR